MVFLRKSYLPKRLDYTYNHTKFLLETSEAANILDYMGTFTDAENYTAYRRADYIYSSQTGQTTKEWTPVRKLVPRAFELESYNRFYHFPEWLPIVARKNKDRVM